ncbi:MAG: sugar ABC transporter ATP-binding protein [Eubacterium sp.]|nr:sugar ABC transporter ATP-binding protein [Eubacterium sp.]
MRRELLRIEQLYKQYHGLPILRGLTMNVYEGEVLGLLSSSQDEKFVLGKILSGSEPADRGRLFFMDRLLTFKNNILRSAAVYIGPEPGVAPNMTIAENFYLADSESSLFFSKRKALTVTQDCLDELSLSFDASWKVDRLNHFEQRLVEIAIAYYTGKKLILIDQLVDEPLTSPNYREAFYTLMSHLKQRGISVILMTASVPDIMYFCSRATVLRDGTDVKTFSEHQFDTQLFNQVFLGTYYYSEADRHHQPDDSDDHAVILHFQTRVSFPDQQAATLSCKIRRGEIVGIIDYGNLYVSELMLFADPKASPLSVRGIINDTTFKFTNLHTALQKGIGFLYGGTSPDQIYHKQDARFNLDITLNQKPSLNPFSIKEKQLTVLLDDFHLRELAESCPDPEAINQLSVIDRQQMILGRWLIARPRVLICVNPYAHFQPDLIRLTNQYFDRLATNGTSVLIFHNYLPIITPLYDRLIFAERGEKRVELWGHELQEPYLFLKENTDQ